MNHHLILRVIAKFTIPLIILFALYVQFHGDYSPGGGFQAGVIFGAAFILYGLLYGIDTVERVIPPAVIRVLAGVGLLLYGLTGVVALLKGGNYLNYSALLENDLAGQHVGIIVIELGVGITVASVMLIIFFAFAGRARP
ncbi:MAG: Na(+)/H(+) antiporter subunit B [Gammaproteobacteria bacterium]|nr:Na(+)/H(+) antiporter subunit B [Gammaproteobacteria bacterium]